MASDHQVGGSNPLGSASGMMGKYTERKRMMKGVFSSAQTLTFKLLNGGKRPSRVIPPSFSESHFAKYAGIDEAKAMKHPLTQLQVRILSRGKQESPRRMMEEFRRVRGEPIDMPQEMPRTFLTRAYLPLRLKESVLKDMAFSEGVHVGYNRNLRLPLSKERAIVFDILSEMLDISARKKVKLTGRIPIGVSLGHIEAFPIIQSLEKKMTDEEIFATVIAVAKKNPRTLKSMDSEIARLLEMSKGKRMGEIARILKIPKAEMLKIIRQIRRLE